MLYVKTRDADSLVLAAEHAVIIADDWPSGR